MIPTNSNDPTLAHTPAEPVTSSESAWDAGLAAAFGSGFTGPNTPTADAAAGTIIADKYMLLQQIGEGGMGTVWMADQTQPIKRRVAVKLIRAVRGNSATILARFEAERQAIALMDHPHIAKLLDAGTTAEGAPYFVMELVKGVPLTEYCDAHKLSIPERLALFQQICGAVQHAHQKGIIHRDLKPTNILVESHDGKPMPKVIDFGLAKATSGLQLSEGTLFTAFGSVMGTPMYMAPEQANFNAVDVDTRADVYALGVILYELLTGTTPITRESMKKAALDEMLRLIREQEAPTPSSRLSTVESMPSVAANRHMEPRNLGRFVKGELDWIVMKALSKERDRRYETANGFARDIERFLNNEAVAAGPPSATYRLRKFARRNRGRVVAAGLVLLALVAGMAGTLWGLVRAERANARLVAKNAELDAERDKVQARFDTAMHAIETFHTGVSEDALLKNPQFKELRTKLLKEAARFYGELEKLLAGQTDAKSRKTLAAGYFQLAELTGKIGDQKQSLAWHRQALAVRRELAAEPGADIEARLDVARSLHAAGSLLRSTGDPAGALSAFQEQSDLAAALEAVSPTDAVRVQLAFGHEGIGLVLDVTGKPAEALDSFRKSLAIYQKLPESEQYPQPGVGPTFGLQLQAGIHLTIGVKLALAGKQAEGLESFRKASDIMQKLADANPANTSVQAYLANGYVNLGAVLLDTGKPEEALEPFREALAIQQKLVDASPAVTEFQAVLGWSHFALGATLLNTGKPAEAQEANRKALAIFQKLVDDQPAVTAFQYDLASVHNGIGCVLVSTGKPAEALEAYRKALAIMQKSADANPANPDYKLSLSNIRINIGMVLGRLKRFAEAFPAFEAGLAIRLKLAEAEPTNTGYSRALGWCHGNRGWARGRAGQPAEAATDLRRALELWAKCTYLDIETQVARARALALLGGLGADAKSGVTKDEAKAFADQSVTALAEVVKAGWALPSELKEPDFDAVRDRPDFLKLFAEVEAKAEPKK